MAVAGREADTSWRWTDEGWGTRSSHSVCKCRPGQGVCGKVWLQSPWGAT